MVMNIKEVMDTIPHRYPFLLVDRVDHLEPGVKAIATKNVTMNEEYFQGHFPGNPIMPGVLIVEALAQVGAITVKSLEEHKDKLVVFAGIDDLRFKRQVVPGDTLRLEVEITVLKRGIGKGNAVAYVGDEVAVKGQLMFALVNQ